MPKKQSIADTAGNSEKEGPRWKVFLDAYLSLGHFGKACQAVGANHTTIRKLLKKIPEFGEAFEDATQVIADKIEDALRQRAVDGYDTLKFDKNGDACIDPRTQEVYVEKKGLHSSESASRIVSRETFGEPRGSLNLGNGPELSTS